LVVLVAIAVIVAAAQGMFNKVNHQQPRPKNNEIMEPNTKQKFPIKLREGQKVLGVTLWTNNAPLRLRQDIAAVGFYVHHDMGTKRLARFKSRPSNANYDQDLENALVQPGMLETVRFKMVGGPGKSSILKTWEDNMRPILEEACGGDEDAVNREIELFNEAFKDMEMVKGDDFSLERRAVDDALYMFEEPEHEDQDPLRRRVGDSSCLTRAFFRERLQHFKNGMTNQMDEFFK
jgi:hypothetical protein